MMFSVFLLSFSSFWSFFSRRISLLSLFLSVVCLCFSHCTLFPWVRVSRVMRVCMHAFHACTSVITFTGFTWRLSTAGHFLLVPRQQHLSILLWFLNNWRYFALAFDFFAEWIANQLNVANVRLVSEPKQSVATLYRLFLLCKNTRSTFRPNRTAEWTKEKISHLIWFYFCRHLAQIFTAQISIFVQLKHHLGRKWTVHKVYRFFSLFR